MPRIHGTLCDAMVYFCICGDRWQLEEGKYQDNGNINSRGEIMKNFQNVSTEADVFEILLSDNCFSLMLGETPENSSVQHSVALEIS